jgi:hypothetical protein
MGNQNKWGIKRFLDLLMLLNLNLGVNYGDS